MKKLLLVLCVLLIAPSITAQVWLPMSTDMLNLESFRHQATASIEDDLDNGIDGTDIFAVNGARIYTNLSNLATGGEHQGDNSYSANTVVIGGTSPLYKGWKVTAFYGNENYNYKYNTESTSNYEWDSNLDDVFDRLRSRYSTTSSGYYSPANTMLINIGKEMGEETEIAFTYRRSGSETKSEYDYSMDSTVTDLTNDNILGLRETFGNIDSTMTIPTNFYSLSYCKPFMDWKLRGDVFLMMGGEKDNLESLDHDFLDRDPSNVLTTQTELDSVLRGEQDEYNGNLIGVGFQLSDENEQTGLLWEVGANYGMTFGSGDYQDLSHDRNVYNFMIGSDVAEYNDLSISDESGPISVSGNVMGINGRMEWQISENVRFGLGILANSFSLTREYDITESDRDVFEFNDGDGIPEATDYVTTTVSGRTYTNTEENSYNRIAVPAGVEVNFGKNKDWFMRLGALATGSKSEVTRTINTTSVQRDSTITVPGVGTPTVTVGSGISYADSENHNSSTYENVDYFYGVGWKPSPNLSLDLIGMFDFYGVELLSTDWLRSLKLSATINVY